MAGLAPMTERENFFERHPDPMWVFDSETLDFLAVNDAAIALYGYSREEFLAMKVTAIRSREDAPVFLASLSETGARYTAQGVWRHVRKSGEQVFAQINAHRIDWSGRPAVMTSARNVTNMVELDHERVTLLRREEAMRRAAESLAAQLAEQNATLRTTQRLIEIGTWKYELWSDTVKWSPELLDLYGVSPGSVDESLMGYMELIHPDDRAGFLEIYEEFERTSALLFEFQHRALRPDGRMIHVRGVAEATETSKGRVLTGVTQDITRRIEQDQRLHLLDLSVGRLNDIVLIFEAGEGAEAAKAPIVYANAAFLRFTGLPQSEVIGWPISDAVAAASPGVPANVLNEVLGNAVSLRSDIRLYSRSGDVVPAEIDLVPVRNAGGALTHWVAVVRDMSERHAAEERRRADEDRYERLLRSTQDVVWDMDLARREIVWNDNFRQMAGDPEAVLDSAPIRSWTDRIHPDDHDRVVEGFFGSIDAGEESWSADYRFVRMDGEVRYVFDRGFVYRDAGGKAVRVVGSMVDTTLQKLAEMRLLQAEKLEALGQITGGVAHDFNNLLTIIIGNTETLLSRAGDPRERRLLELVASASERGRDLTGRLLAFARRIPLKPVLLDLNEQTERSAELLRRTFPSNIHIAVSAGAPDARIECDPGQLELVILNLAVNARDAIPGEGVLTLSTRLDDEDGEAKVVLTVSDTGTGMDAEVLRRCLEPFFTTKPVGQGVGLGLSMAFGFMAQSGGRLLVESEPGKGTRASLIFPQADETAITARPEPFQGEPVGGHEHVLLVEDDQRVREHVSRLLTELGYQVTARDTADSAIAYLQTGGEADLLFTDVVMPGSASVPDLVAAARAALPGISVLFTSGYPREVFEKGLLDKSVGLLSKPYRRAELAAKLREALQPSPLNGN